MGMLLRRHRKGKAEPVKAEPTKVVDKPAKEPKKQKK